MTGYWGDGQQESICLISIFIGFSLRLVVQNSPTALVAAPELNVRPLHHHLQGTPLNGSQGGNYFCAGSTRGHRGGPQPVLPARVGPGVDREQFGEHIVAV